MFLLGRRHIIALALFATILSGVPAVAEELVLIPPPIPRPVRPSGPIDFPDSEDGAIASLPVGSVGGTTINPFSNTNSLASTLGANNASNVANGLGINNGSNPANNLVAHSGASLEGALSALATGGPDSQDPSKNITLFNVRAGSTISMLMGKDTSQLAAVKLKDDSLKITNLNADDQVALVADITYQQNQVYLDEQVTHNLVSGKMKLSPRELEDMLNSPTFKVPGA